MTIKILKEDIEPMFLIEDYAEKLISKQSKRVEKQKFVLAMLSMNRICNNEH
jgi:hypothetical protein